MIKFLLLNGPNLNLLGALVVGGWSDALEYVDKVKMLSLIYLSMKKNNHN